VPVEADEKVLIVDVAVVAIAAVLNAAVADLATEKGKKAHVQPM
jgi:hypothetical protein